MKELRDAGKSVWLQFRNQVDKLRDKYRPGKEVVHRGIWGWFAGKNNPLQEKMTLVYMRSLEGKLSHLADGNYDNWPESRIAFKKKMVDENKPVHFKQITSTMIVLGVGLLIAFISYLFERFTSK